MISTSMSEIENIKRRYEEREKNKKIKKHYSNNLFSEYIAREREKHYENILKEVFSDFSSIKVMEIGAGSGSNLSFFKRTKVPPENIFANELLPNRVEMLRKNHPDINIFPGNALELNFRGEFDIVFQSTVFTSVLDDIFRQQLADKMWSMLKPDGIVLWYDFIFSNPANKDVRKVTKTDIRKLFPSAQSIIFHKATLAPPIGRKVGKLYNLINSLFPFLRTHVIAIIYK